MKILVTGANGYIGSKVIKRLLDNGHEVVANDICSEHIDERATIYNCDIFLEKCNWMEFFGYPEVCLHMAWRDGFVHNSLAHMIDLSAHFGFLLNLINNGLKHLCVMGSMHEIGYFVGQVKDNVACTPTSLYGIAKNSLRESLEIVCSSQNIIFQWLRGFYIYGDDEYGNSIFCKLRAAVKEGKKTFPFTMGKNEYDFIHIDTLTEQIGSVISQKSIKGIINVCSGHPVSLASQIEKYILDNKLQIELDYGHYPDRPYDSPCIYGDESKIKTIINQNKRVLVTGANGQLGYDVLRELKERGYTNVRGIDIADLDITNEEDVREYILNYNPDIIMHNAAYTAVDKAEEFDEVANNVNVLGTKYIASVAKDINAKLVYISTDYVFDGDKKGYYTTEDVKNPLSIYGKTKSGGEDVILSLVEKHFIIRISWVFGLNGNNFVKTMLNLAKAKKEISVVCDQEGSPTYTYDLVKLLCDMIATDKYGTYHATNEGTCSWYELAKKIFQICHIDVNVSPIKACDYPSKAKRPLNSKMNKEKLTLNGFNLLPHWEDAVKRYLEELKQ